MAHAISTETSSTWLLQAKDFLVEARRLKPGPARNDLRQLAKILREIAKVEGQSAGENLIGADWSGAPVTESFRERATSAPKHLWQQG